MNTQSKKSMIVIALLMLVKKLLSIVYKIPYQNLTGDAGFYVFQQVYPFIGILMILTGFALPTVIGSLLAEHAYRGVVKDKIKRYMWIFSLSVFTVMFLGNRQLAQIMGDVRLAPVIGAAGVHFLFLPPLAYLRGVLASRVETMDKFGHSVVIEQLARVFAIIFVLFYFDVTYYNYYQIAQLAFLFSLISPVITFAHLLLMKPVDDVESFSPLTGNITFFSRTIYLVLSSGMLVLFSLVDSFIVFNVLITEHAQNHAMILRGILERGLPIVQAGTFYVGTFVTYTLSSMDKEKESSAKSDVFSNGFFYILALATPATVGLIRLMPVLNVALYGDVLGVATLQVMMIQIILYAVIVILVAVLTKEEKNAFVQVALLVGMLSKLIFTVPLVSWFGITGAGLSSVMSLAFICVILLVGAKHLFTFKLAVLLTGVFIATVGMFLGLRATDNFLATFYTGERAGYVVLLVLTTLTGLLIYGGVLLLLFLGFKAVGAIVLRKHKQKKERAKRAYRAKMRRLEALRLEEEAARQAAAREREAFEARERYRQSLMQNKPRNGQQSMNNVATHLAGKGHYEPIPVQVSPQPREIFEQTTPQKKQKEGKKMRLDKFLKVSRIIKRRQTAKEVSDAGKIDVNGKVAKSSTTVQIGDEIALHYATRTLVVKVLEIKDSTKKEDAERMFEVVKEIPSAPARN